MRTIYRITGYGDTAYYRHLTQAEDEIRAIGGDHATVRLYLKGTRIYDGMHIRADWLNKVGDVIDEGEVPERDRWQIKGDDVSS